MGEWGADLVKVRCFRDTNEEGKKLFIRNEIKIMKRNKKRKIICEKCIFLLLKLYGDLWNDFPTF